MTRVRVDQHESWTRENPILEDGELALEKETRKLKIGDGVTHWNDLPYWLMVPETLDGGNA